jgi:hypothetical protein
VRLFGTYARFAYELTPLPGRHDQPATVTDQYFTAGIAAYAKFR